MTDPQPAEPTLRDINAKVDQVLERLDQLTRRLEPTDWVAYAHQQLSNQTLYAPTPPGAGLQTMGQTFAQTQAPKDQP